MCTTLSANLEGGSWELRRSGGRNCDEQRGLSARHTPTHTVSRVCVAAKLLLGCAMPDTMHDVQVSVTGPLHRVLRRRRAEETKRRRETPQTSLLGRKYETNAPHSGAWWHAATWSCPQNERKGETHIKKESKCTWKGRALKRKVHADTEARTHNSCRHHAWGPK